MKIAIGRFSTLTCIVLVTTFLLSCNSSIFRRENLCSLSPEQAPEIRGFKIGMTVGEIRQEYPSVCKNVQFVDRAFVTIRTWVPQLPEVVITDKDRSVTKDISNPTCDNAFESVDQTTHPELEGVYKIQLAINSDRLTGMNVYYGRTQDASFFTNFHETARSKLGLNEWSNIEEENHIVEDSCGGFWCHTFIKRQTLQCNGFAVETNTAISRVRGATLSVDTTSLSVVQNSLVPLSEVQKRENFKQSEKEAEAERNKKLEEEKRKSDGFVP